MTSNRNRSRRGFTLVEVAVASVIFLFVAVAAFKAFTESNNVYKRGDQYAAMQQRTRMAFESMMTELRLAGYDYNRDGSNNTYPDQPDEQLEWIGPHAIVFRGNLDYSDGTTGRETAYESDPASANYQTTCCPIVTTANDEIVAYALRSNDSTRNTSNIVFKADTSRPRDGGFDAGGLPNNEETVTFPNVEFTGNYPPYTLMRFSLDDAGNVVERPIATDIRGLNFTYQGADGNNFWCQSPEADGSCLTSNQVAFGDLGGANDIQVGDSKRRSGRAAVRRIVTELVGETELDLRQYKDNDTLMPRRPKLSLEAAVVPQNLGLKGSPDLEDSARQAPAHVTVCAGQCNTVRVEWDKVDDATGYNVKLYSQGATDPFFVGVTPGVAVTGDNRVFAFFQRPDASALVTGAHVYAKVQSRYPGDQTSEDSEQSLTATLNDVTRPSAPTSVQASGFNPLAYGWPDVTTNLIPPDTTNASGNGALENKIVVSWIAPFWALNVTNPSDPANTWTTAQTGGSPPLSCDTQSADLDGNGTYETTRTRLHEQFGTTRYLVFRSTNPRFVPTNADFVGAIQGDVDLVPGRVAYVDRTHHVFTNGVFNRTDNVLANCTNYYYRVRAVDDCWDGTNPAGPGNVHVSPFAPPLNTNPSAQNSDDTSMVNPADVGVAIPGFAVPKASPRNPTGLRFNNYDRRTDDGDGLDATIAFDAVKLDNTMNGTTPAYEDLTVQQYLVYSNPSNQNFTLSDMKNLLSGTRLDKTITVADLKAGRIARDDENGDGTITAAEDESVPPVSGSASPASGLRIDFPDTSQRWYKVVAVQCRSEDTVPTADPTLYDYGTPSAALRFPCDFGGGQYTTITLDSSNFPTSVTSDAIMENPSVGATAARLVLKDRATGDRTITPSPGKTPSSIATGSWRATFNSTDIAALTDNFGNGNYLIAVEWTDVNGCLGVSEADTGVVAPPSCCLAAVTPIITRVTTTQGKNTVSISCGAAALRLMKITVTVDNANNGQQEKFDTVYWDDPDAADDRSFTSNRTNDTFDMTSNPPVLGLGQTGVLIMNFTRNASGDNVTIKYDYKIGGAPGSCTFTGTM